MLIVGMLLVLTITVLVCASFVTKPTVTTTPMTSEEIQSLIEHQLTNYK